MSNKSWDRTISVARYEYRREIALLVLAVCISIACIPWGWFSWDGGWAGVGYLALGWFFGIVCRQLLKAGTSGGDTRLSVALVCCIFAGSIAWWYFYELAGLSFFGLLTATFAAYAAGRMRDKRAIYRKLTAWNLS